MDILKGIVCIKGMKGDIGGTGFVISDDGLIATCAHALGKHRPEKALVMFQSNGEEREATVLAEAWRAVDAEDIALLKVDGPLPAEVQRLPFGTSLGTKGHPLYTFGYPKAGEVEGVGGSGTILGHGATTSTGLPLLQLRSNEITQGFSGAPVWDEVRNRVVGIVVIAAKPDKDSKLADTAFATPTETLQKVFPQMFPVDDICPYRNLEAFTEAHAKFFHGREGLVKTLIKQLQDEPRFLAVFGPSGSGKSSVVQAGLIPHLRQGKLHRGDPCDIIVTRPTDTSFKGYLATLKETSTPVPVALIVDQFEELFVSYDEGAALEVTSQLTDLLEYKPHITLLLVMRDDFFSSFVKHKKLAAWLNRNMAQVQPTLEREEVEAIIRKPAKQMGWQFEEGLIEMLIKDVEEASAKGSRKEGKSTILPLLEFTLTQLWQKRQDGFLTREAYRSIGGITGGLSKWAEDAYCSFEEPVRPLVSHIFTDLVYLGDEEKHTAHSRRRRELSALVCTEAERDTVYQIGERLIARRLLVLSQNGENGLATVEIIHDSLLWEWSRLSRWLKDEHDFLIWRQELERFEKRAHVERKSHEDVSVSYKRASLLKGEDLHIASGWLETHSGRLNQALRTYIQTSVKQRWITRAITVIILLALLTAGGGTAWFYESLIHPNPAFVTTLQDGVNGSLRYCINNAPSGSTITFAPNLSGTINLAGSPLVLEAGKHLTIRGPGAGRITITGGNTDVNAHVNVHVSESATLTVSHLSFSNTLTNGGGFLFNEGTLIIESSIISGNIYKTGNSGLGGGVFNALTGILTVRNSIISHNEVISNTTSEGGGIYNEGKLTISDSTVTDNQAASTGSNSYGGGIANAGKLTISDSAVTNNQAASSSSSNSYSGDGGGIANAPTGLLSLIRSTLSNNQASGTVDGKGEGQGLGGGIANDGGILSLTYSTLSNNRASGSISAGGGVFNRGKLFAADSTITNNLTTSSNSRGFSNNLGGGIANYRGAFALIRFCTIYHNTAEGDGGGGIAIDYKESYLEISSSIVAANSAAQDADIQGALTSGGYNLIQNFDGARGLNSTTDKPVTLSDLKLDSTLNNNGGPTQTLKLLQGSSAVGAVPGQACSVVLQDVVNGQLMTLTTDQRGKHRPQGAGNACDSGAYEMS